MMANRPIFIISEFAPYYFTFDTEFKWAGGLALSQKRKNISSMHQQFKTKFPDKKVLEISSKSTENLGVNASAFNLKKYVPSVGAAVPVENIYQSSKVFSSGGPFVELLQVTPIEAKRDDRLKSSGRLVSFRFEKMDYPIVPDSIFYDFIYINALIENPKIGDALTAYDGFTDIAFNPSKNISCQARSAAVYVSLCRIGKLDSARNFDRFLTLFYPNRTNLCSADKKRDS